MMIKLDKSATRAAETARERILRTAHLLFYRDGIRATGVDRIIAEAQVTKVTFYRHFPSKDALIKAFLEGRHQVWLTNFNQAVARHHAAQSAAQKRNDPLAPVLLAVTEWLEDDAFRGCAFVNTVAEIGAHLPDVLEIALRHKHETAQTIAPLLAGRANADMIAFSAALAVDGAVVHAQRGDNSVSLALEGLKLLLNALARKPA